MANYRAMANGNWSNLAIWQDNSSGSFVASTVLPGVNDDVYANAFQVTIDQDINVKSIRNNSTTGISNGSYSGFYITSSRTLTFTGLGVVRMAPNFGAWWMSLIYITGSNLTLNITGDVISDNIGNSGTISMSGSNITVNITGNVYMNPFQSDSYTIAISANNTVNHVGNVYGATTSNTLGSCPAIRIAQNAIYNLTGNAIGRSAQEVIGSIASGFVASTNALCNIIGSTVSAGQTVVYGNVLKMAGIINNFGDYSVSPYMIKTFDGQQLQWNTRTTTNVLNPLYTAGVATGHPATNNVRTGVVYGPTNNLTGTCAVPPAAAVSVGVPVDNTVGTAQLDANALAIALDAALTASLTPALTTSLDASLSASLPAAIAPLLWDEDVANLTTPNSIGERVKNCATVATTGAQIASFNP